MPYESNWSVTAAGTDSGATATLAADSTRQWIVTGISGHTDTDSTIQITDGTNVLFESKIDVSVSGIDFIFSNMVIPIGTGNAAKGIVTSSSSDCQVTIWGSSAP